MLASRIIFVDSRVTVLYLSEKYRHFETLYPCCVSSLSLMPRSAVVVVEAFALFIVRYGSWRKLFFMRMESGKVEEYCYLLVR